MNKSEDMSMAESLASLAIALIAIAPLTIYAGWLSTFVWQWFVADTFHVQPLRIVDAIGVQYMVSWFLSQLPRRNETEGVIKQLVDQFITITLLFLFASIVHVFQ